MAAGSQELRGRVNLLGQDGTPIPAEFIAIARLDEDGAFAGANGSVRDMRERDRLERELRDRRRASASSSRRRPDVIYRCDAEGRFLFMAEGSEALFGWTPDEVVGHDLRRLRPPRSRCRWRSSTSSRSTSERDVVRRFRYMLKHRDGTHVPGRDHRRSRSRRTASFAGVQGTVRDISASRSGSSASCASPRSATGSSSRTRRTSSSRPTPRAASRSCRRPSSG